MGFDRFRQWIIAQAAFGLLGILKLFPTDAALNFAAWLGRRVGPKLKRHKLVVTNLRNAFPEKSEAEIQQLAMASWEHLGRMAAEYIFFDRLFDAAELRKGNDGRVEIVGEDYLRDLRENPRPFIFITAHTGNFEVLPHAAVARGNPVAVLFRPPNNPFIAEKLARMRGVGAELLVPSLSGSFKILTRQLAQGKGMGILVDQKFLRGVPTRFFGLEAKTNPLVPRLARQFHCEIVPVRSIRIAGNRYRLIVEPPLALPRNEAGEIDIEASAQALNDKVESWVREYPEQWLWYHDRWDIKRTLR